MIPKFEDEPFFHIPSSPENLHHDRNTIPNFIQEKEEKRKEREREREREREKETKKDEKVDRSNGRSGMISLVLSIPVTPCKTMQRTWRLLIK